MTLSTLTDQIWSALQRPSPSVTKEEINEIISAWYDKLGAVDNIADDNERLRAIAIRSINKYYDRQREVRAAAPPKTPEHALVHEYFEGAVGDVLLAGLPGETPPKYYLRWRNEDGKEHRLPLDVREEGGEGTGG